MTQKPALIFLFLFGFVSCTWGQSSESASFQESFVRVSEENPYYFELSNGETYIPNGLNLCWAKDMDVMETYFRKLSENGGNFARIWLNYPQHEIELEYGKVDEANAIGRSWRCKAKTYRANRSLCRRQGRHALSRHAFCAFLQRRSGSGTCLALG